MPVMMALLGIFVLLGGLDKGFIPSTGPWLARSGVAAAGMDGLPPSRFGGVVVRGIPGESFVPAGLRANNDKGASFPSL